jgi:hypothetical protein
VYIYHNQNNVWSEIQVLENTKSRKGDTYGHAIASFDTRLAIAKSAIKYQRQDSVFQGTSIELFQLNSASNKFELDTVLVAPQELLLKSFGNEIAMNKDKIYVGSIGNQNANIILVYDLDCQNQWILSQIIKPKNAQRFDTQTFHLSLSCNQNLLAIGTVRSNFKNYFDASVLQKGNAILYEYHLDSTLLGKLKITQENSYLSPSGKKHFYSKLFYDTIVNQKGCDSIIAIDLTILTKNQTDSNKFDTVNLAKKLSISKTERPTNLIKRVTSETDLVHISMYDFGNLDQDSLSMKMNGDWILNNHELTKEIYTTHIVLKKGVNTFVIHAENEGSEPPNTARIKITDTSGKEIADFTLRSTLEESTSFIIDY